MARRGHHVKGYTRRGKGGKRIHVRAHRANNPPHHHRRRKARRSRRRR